MGYSNQQEAVHADAYTYPPPPPRNSHPPREQAYTVPPPAGYPVKDGAAQAQQVPAETKSRGDGFWEGCCAALCCCCVLETCF